MLYGIRNERQLELVKEGYKMRVYVPYGNDWYGYFMRRLAERPANVAFVLKGMVKITRSKYSLVILMLKCIMCHFLRIRIQLLAGRR